MSTIPSTPRRQPSSGSTTTPQTARVATSHVIQSSPHYTTTRRHSLYGTEDRIILDPGSRIWKVGFSGEGKPRGVFFAGGQNSPPLWGLNRAPILGDREEEDRMLEARLQTCLRYVFHEFVPFASCFLIVSSFVFQLPSHRPEVQEGHHCRAPSTAPPCQGYHRPNIVQQPPGICTSSLASERRLLISLGPLPLVCFKSSPFSGGCG